MASRMTVQFLRAKTSNNLGTAPSSFALLALWRWPHHRPLAVAQALPRGRGLLSPFALSKARRPLLPARATPSPAVNAARGRVHDTPQRPKASGSSRRKTRLTVSGDGSPRLRSRDGYNQAALA